MEEKFCILFKPEFNKFDNSEIVVLEPVRLLRGTIENDGSFKDKKGQIVKHINQMDFTFTDGQNGFYMFPIDISKIVEKNFITKDNETIATFKEDLLMQYYDEVSQYHYYLKFDSSKPTVTYCIFDYKKDFGNQIDPSLNFYDVIDALDKQTTYYAVEQKEVDKVQEPITVKDCKLDFDYRQMYEEISKNILGQDEAIKQILVTLKKHYLSTDVKNKANLLVAGSTGTGKTAIFNLLAKKLGIPMVVVDSTKFTQEGYVGRSVEEAIEQLYRNSSGNLANTEKGIVVFDEIDKKANFDSRETVANKAVLDSLLKILDGSQVVIPRIGEVNTEKIVFAGLGAFSGIIEQKQEKPTIGFEKSTTGFTNTSYVENLTTDDFIQYGLSPEFMGRINKTILLNELTVADLVNILLNSENNVLKSNKEILAKLGVVLNYEEEAIQKMAELAFERKLGARTLATIVNQTLDPAFAQILSEPSKYKKLIITKKTNKNPKGFKLS